MGWKLIDANVAFKSAVYKTIPKNVLNDESLIWTMAKEKGDKSLCYPVEDSIYEKKKMDELGL